MLRIERILCPTDLSHDAGEALRYGVALARSYDATLYLCYCAENLPVSAAAAAGAQATLAPEALEHIRSHFAHSIVENLGLGDFGKIKWEGIVVEADAGDRADAIARAAAERRVDLIVMRSRRRPHRAALLGSTAEAISRIAPCPVFVTHPQEREWVGRATGEIDLERVLVAYDFSDDAERALGYALSLAQEYGAELHLLHVIPKPATEGPEIAWGPAGVEAAYNDAAQRLQNVIPEDAYLWCDIKHQVRWGKAYQEILAYASEHEIDLICMGASGKNFSIGALFGSNVDRVLRQAPCPVFVARPLKPNLAPVCVAHAAGLSAVEGHTSNEGW